MSVVLLILKIIGITLLAILGLLILVVLLVLFVPVRYLLNVNKAEEDDICAEVKLSWLLHLLRINVKYYNELTYYVKLLFFTVVKSENLITEKEKIKAEKKEERKKRREEKRKLKEEKKLKAQEENDTNIDAKEDNTVNATKDTVKDTVSDTVTDKATDISRDSAEVTEKSLDKQEQDTKKDSTVIDKLLFVINKFIDFIFNINDKFFDVINKIDEIWDEIDFYLDVINDERNRAAVAICVDKIKEILHSIRPRKVKGYIHAGFDDPYTNGKMMSIYGILLPIIHDKIQLVPEYDKEVLDGYLIVKGRITVFVALKLLYVYYFNKDVKRLKKIFKSHKA